MYNNAFSSHGKNMKSMIRDSVNPAILVLSLMLLEPTITYGGEIFRWIDEDGTVHMTDSLASIPPKYRDQSVKRTLEAASDAEVKPTRPLTAADGNTEGFSSNRRHYELPFHAYEGSARRIIIPVTFNDSVTARLLLDTGAPGLTISPKLADRVGLINERDGNLLVMTGGIGGAVPAMLAIVDTVNVGEARAEFLPAIITDIPSDEFEGLVGMDFMANYRISIDNEQNIISFDELAPQTDRPGGHDEVWWRSHFRKLSKLQNEWREFLNEAANSNLTSSETDRILKIVRNQTDEAGRIYRKLETYARDKAVPLAWRH